MEPRCPHCNTPVEVEEEFEMDYDYHDSVKRVVLGSCPECGRTYSWSQIFVFSENIDFKEDEDD